MRRESKMKNPNKLPLPTAVRRTLWILAALAVIAAAVFLGWYLVNYRGYDAYKAYITAPAALEMVIPVLEGIGEWKEDVIHDRVMEAIAAAGMKNGAVLWPMRIALSGLESTPGGAFEIAYLLGKEETLRRIRDGIARLG